MYSSWIIWTCLCWSLSVLDRLASSTAMLQAGHPPQRLSEPLPRSYVEWAWKKWRLSTPRSVTSLRLHGPHLSILLARRWVRWVSLPLLPTNMSILEEKVFKDLFAGLEPTKNITLVEKVKHGLLEKLLRPWHPKKALDNRCPMIRLTFLTIIVFYKGRFYYLKM